MGTGFLLGLMKSSENNMVMVTVQHCGLNATGAILNATGLHYLLSICL